MVDIGGEARLLSLGESDTETLVRRPLSNDSEKLLSNYKSKFGETKLIVQETCKNLESLWYVVRSSNVLDLR